MLLTLPSEEDRIDLLPDCFTPPLDQDAEGGGGQGTHQHSFEEVSGMQGGAGGVEEETEADSDELWCTPAQLLNELDARLRQMVERSGPAGGEGEQHKRLLSVVDGQLAGQELQEALQGLRVHVHAYFMQAMRKK
jgi:hypothetical protein